MKTTDYSKIASTYDRDKKRAITSPDEILRDALIKTDTRPFHVLDLGCGTGNYLAFNTHYYNHEHIIWHGLDASVDMLAVAKQKTDKADFQHGDAHQLPYDDCTFDYVLTEFAFHHFIDKSRVLAEITRILK